MTIIYFPNESKWENVSAFSPLDRLICQQKPFGDITAEEYLGFARKDLLQGVDANLVNALSNSKRCFHYQVDRLLFRYGLRKASTELDFPHKIELLSELKIVSGTLLRVFNRERNAMEHEYTSPSKEIVEGSVDLCDLLLLATERFLHDTPRRVRVKFKDDDRDIILLLEHELHIIQFLEILGTELTKEEKREYYTPVIFDAFTDKLREGFTIKRIDKQDIELTLSNKEKWMPLLKIFSAAARTPSGFEKLPDKPMISIQHTLPLKDFPDFQSN